MNNCFIFFFYQPFCDKKYLVALPPSTLKDSVNIPNDILFFVDILVCSLILSSDGSPILGNLHVTFHDGPILFVWPLVPVGV